MDLSLEKKTRSSFSPEKKSGSNFLVFYASYQQNPKTYRPNESEGGSAGRWPGVGGATFYEADLRSLRDLAHPLRNDPA